MTGRVPPVAYLAALILYVALGFMTKSVVLNWILGPLFPLLVLDLAPRALSKVFRR